MARLLKKTMRVWRWDDGNERGSAKIRADWKLFKKK